MENQKKGLNVNVKSFVAAIVIIFVLMVLTFILTFVIPGGEYARVDGLIVADSFKTVEGGLPFWKWLLSPFLVLGADGSASIIAVLIFLLVLGGAFNCLEKCGLMNYMLEKIVHKYEKSKYKLLAIITFFFMALGSCIGSFEECVPLVPIVIALSIKLGWDNLTGVGTSLLAIGCGFAAGVFNPFTVGVAQGLAGLPMFSGVSLRLISFVLIYLLLVSFITRYAKKIEKPVEDSETLGFEKNSKMDKALVCFATILAIGILLVLLSSVLTFLQDYTMIIIAVMFLIAGISSTIVAGSSIKSLGKYFVNGSVSIAPAILMILMASSIKYTLTEGKILDTILHSAIGLAESFPKWAVILFVYLIVLVLNFFIPSGSAKAFLVIPLVVPIAQIFGISAQLCIMAYAFGDGFSNVLYPTNPVLLLSLGLGGVDYPKWFKWSVPFQLINIVLTSLILLFGLMIGY